MGADKIFSKDNLKVTFNTFDKDRSGSITLAELKAVLDPEE